MKPEDLLSDSHLEGLMAGYSPDHATPAASLNPPPLPPHAENPWGASIVTIDKDGNAVACNVTMNDIFGSGRMIPGTGIVLAPPPNQSGEDPFNTGPMLVTGNVNAQAFFVAAASGGVTAPSAIAQVFLTAVVGSQSLEQAINQGRFHHNGQPDVVFSEANADQSAVAALQGAGHVLQQAPIIGRVQALYCPQGVKDSKVGCQANADPRGDGLAALLQ